VPTKTTQSAQEIGITNQYQFSVADFQRQPRIIGVQWMPY